MITKLFKSSVYVKPLTANDDDSRWLVITHTPITGFVDDLLRYGWRVAVYNFRVEMK